ncbi:MAG: hypothetical protein GX639_14710 [Fibrobacter sp.]|nr:hypothetical protein [Fibrobacter sp.]
MKLNNKYVWIGTVLVTAIVVAGVYLGTYQEKQSNENPLKKIVDAQEFKSILDSAGSRIQVFDLYADWCAPCKMIEPTLSSLSEKYGSTVDFYRVNIDENPQIASLFKTQVIPYVVFVKNGKVITSFSGVTSQGSYEKVITLCEASTEPCDKLIQNL